MKIPKTLRISGITWKVEQVDGSQVSEDFAIGCMDERTQTIKLDKSLSQEMKEATLLHEIFHCIDYQLEHDLVEMLSNQLYQVLKENKLLNENN